MLVCISVTASIGISPLVPDIADGYELLRRADVALYEAKESGRGRIVDYLGELDAQRNRRTEMDDKLRRVIENREVRPAFQPLVER